MYHLSFENANIGESSW